MRQVKRPRSWRTGVTLRQVSFQPTQSSQHNGQNVESQAAGVTFHLPGGHNAKSHKTDNWRPQALTFEVTSSAERETARAPTQSVKSSGSDDANLGCGRNHACCNEFGLRGRSRFRAPQVATSNSENLNERFRVCEEQTRTCVTAQRPECQQARAPRNPPLPRLFFQAAGVTFQLHWEERRACLSVVCSLLLFSLLPVFRTGFPGVVQKQGVRSSHSGHPRG